MHRTRRCGARAGQRIALAAAAGLSLASACGGSEGTTRAEEPAAPETDEASENQDMIPERRFVEIRHTFDRRQSDVSRCFSTAVEAGELSEDDRGYVTVGLVITEKGNATDLSVLEATLDSDALHDCILGRVEQWNFGSLPRPLDYSYSYRFEKL